MVKISASIEITNADDIRVHARQGGGFHLVIGPTGGETVMLSFPQVSTAEAVAAVLTTSAIAHGRFGDALAVVASALGSKPSKPRLSLVTGEPDQPEPPRAA